MASLFGAVEAGGTKFVCAVGEDPAEPQHVKRFTTSHNPLETVKEVVEYFQAFAPLRAVGVASFGPLDLRAGTITNTPKIPWQNFPLRDALRRAVDAPVGFDTDVNGAALGESLYGAGRGRSNFVYWTVGTGIGAGAIAGGVPIHGMLHPEMGHLLVRRTAEEAASFRGVCPFHGECLEGVASGPAIRQRWGANAHELPPEHPAWRLEAQYLAQACHAVCCTLSPEAIVLGGGVMSQEHLFPMIREEMEKLIAGYLRLPEISPPALPFPGLTGALILAQRAEEEA